MISVQTKKIASIPSLIVTKTKQLDQPLPLFVYFHGFTSAKEHNLPIAYLLAQEGYRVVLPDSHYHGAREKGVSESKRHLSFFEIVLNNVAELELIRDYFATKELIADDRIGIAGTSMGGITTAAALTKYEWIKAAGIFMGSPQLTKFAQRVINRMKQADELPVSDEAINDLYEQLEQYDLSKQISLLNERPLFMWHGEADSVVPFEDTYQFYHQVKDHYENKGMLKFVPEKDTDHKVSRFAILEAVKWFKKHL